MCIIEKILWKYEKFFEINRSKGNSLLWFGHQNTNICQYWISLCKADVKPKTIWWSNQDMWCIIGYSFVTTYKKTNKQYESKSNRKWGKSCRRSCQRSKERRKRYPSIKSWRIQRFVPFLNIFTAVNYSEFNKQKWNISNDKKMFWKLRKLGTEK